MAFSEHCDRQEMFWCAAVAVQYGGQPQTGMGVPAVGMAMPNYSGQPQYGFANQEVAWYGLCRRLSNFLFLSGAGCQHVLFLLFPPGCLHHMFSNLY